MKKTKKSYMKLANLNVHRTLIKKAIMTIPYNASSQSIVNYIKEEFNLIKNTNYTEGAVQKVFYIYQLKKDPSVIFEEREFQILRKALIFILID
jgi:hypothetical protein